MIKNNYFVRATIVFRLGHIEIMERLTWNKNPSATKVIIEKLTVIVKLCVRKTGKCYKIY